MALLRSDALKGAQQRVVMDLLSDKEAKIQLLSKTGLVLGEGVFNGYSAKAGEFVFSSSITVSETGLIDNWQVVIDDEFLFRGPVTENGTPERYGGELILTQTDVEVGQVITIHNGTLNVAK